jgi:YidC/Oxa1 family membrane protein insertase
MNDKNSTIGLLLMMALLGVYFFFVMPQAQREVDQMRKQQQEQNDTSSTDNDQQPSIAAEQEAPQVPDSVKQQQLVSSFGPFAKVMDGEGKLINVKTDVLDLTLNTKGGMISAAVLPKYKTYGGEPLPLLVENENYLMYDFAALVNSRSIGIESSDIIYDANVSELVLTGNESQELKLVADLGENRRIEHIYTFKGDKYDVDFKVQFSGMDQVMKNSYLSMDWNMKVPLTEKDIKPQRMKTDISYRQDGVENMGGRMGGETSEESIRNGIDWISLRSQFFSTALIPERPFSDAQLLSTTPTHEDYVKDLSAKMALDLERTDEGRSMTMTWFMGPNEYRTLKSYDQELEKQLDLGWGPISLINKVTIWLFKQMESIIGNYGIIILIFAFLVKLIVFPMTYKSYVSMAKLRVINQTDEMKALDEKYKGDPQKLNLEKMAVYRKMKVSPLGGCLPMLLQYPILIAMFYFFPQSVELRQKSFLWAEDLSTYDSIYDFPAGFSIPGYGDHISLFCLLMVVSIYVYTYFQQKSQATNTAAMPFLKYLPYIFPIMFLIFLNNYSSGLSWYYFAANIISIIQTTGIRATLDDEKLLNQMRAVAHSKKKGKGGKSKAGKSRLERWAEKQQAKQREALDNRRNGQQKGNRSARRKNKK